MISWYNLDISNRLIGFKEENIVGVLIIPKDKRARKSFFIIIAIMLCLLAAVGFSLDAILNDQLTITIGESVIEPGDTQLSELLSDGYQISGTDDGEYSSEKQRDVYNVFYDPETRIEGNTLLRGTVLVKGDEPYAYVNLITGGKTKKLKNCLVEDIILYQPLLDTERCTIDGIPLEEVTVERITENRGEFKEQFGPDSEEMLTTIWTKGGYELWIKTDSSNKITEITAKDKRVIRW